jgi:hypothetical protein
MRTEFHFWLVSKDPETLKPYLVYACPAREGEDHARQRGLELLGGADFTISRLKTRDLSRASSLLKGSRLEQYHSLKKAGQRLGHDKTIVRDKKRKTDRERKIRKGSKTTNPLW